MIHDSNRKFATSHTTEPKSSSPIKLPQLTPRPTGSRRRSPQPNARGRSAQAQAQDPRTRPPLLLHGRKVPGMLHNHDRLLARPDGGPVCRVLSGAVPADRWQGPADRGMLVPEKVEVWGDGDMNDVGDGCL